MYLTLPIDSIEVVIYFFTNEQSNHWCLLQFIRFRIETCWHVNLWSRSRFFIEDKITFRILIEILDVGSFKINILYLLEWSKTKSMWIINYMYLWPVFRIIVLKSNENWLITKVRTMAFIYMCSTLLIVPITDDGLIFLLFWF